MYHRRINPNKEFINQVIELSDRVAAVETQPSGDIVIRETLTTTNPETGVTTAFGQLPNGDFGFKPFIYDLMPPPVASRPIVKAEPGAFIVSWDGVLFGDVPDDFVCVNIIGHKVEGETTISSTAVGTITRPLDFKVITTDVAVAGETWQFSLESEDYNGNKAEWGLRSLPLVMLSYMADTSINEAVNSASAAASAAVNAAGTALTTANGKNAIFYEPEPPAGSNYAQDDIWFDTNNDNKPHRWRASDSSWIPSLFGNDAIFGNLDIGKASVGFLSTSVLKSKSIGTDKLVITSTDNLVNEADFSNLGLSWGTLNANKTINPTSGRGGLPAFRVTGVSTPQYLFNLNNKISVDSVARFRGAVSVKSTFDLVAGAIALKMRCYLDATNYTVVTITSNPLLVANTWTTFGDISPELPLNTVAIEFFIEVQNPTVGIITDIDFVGVTRAMDGKLVVDGTITAPKLDTILVLATSIIAGDPTGTHAQMDPFGFRVFAADPSDNIPNEVVRMGVANTDDFFAITKSDGTLAATISQDGVISATGVYANESLYYKGDELGEVLLNRSGGVRAYGTVEYGGYGSADNIRVGSNSVYGLASDSIIMEGNRVYRIVFHTPTWLFEGAAGGELQLGFNIRVANPGDTTQITMANSWTIKNFIRTVSSIGSWESDTFETTVNVGAPEHGKRLQVIVYAWKGPAGVADYIRFHGTAHMYINDDGPLPGAMTVVKNSGGGSQFDGNPAPPAPARNTYVRQYGAYDSRSYTGGNGIYNYNTGQMYQGLSPAGYGNLKSLSLHGDMTADLSGATINYIRVYFNFNHWYYNGGGTARIGVHGHTGIPGSFSQNGIVVTSGGWPKPGARWVDIPSAHWEGFRTGAHRGITLEGDGTYNTYGYADRPTIEISFTK